MVHEAVVYGFLPRNSSLEPLMSNSSMHDPDPDLDFDDTRMTLQGASCTIAAHTGRAVAYSKKSGFLGKIKIGIFACFSVQNQ